MTAKKSDLQARAERKLKAVLKKAHAIRALKGLAPSKPWSAQVSLIGPTAMKKLNRRYRGKNYVTDVLSFEAPAAFRAHGMLGELVICGSVLKSQAREYGHREQLELQILLVHGVLHLLGFDHEKSARGASEMRRWEARLLGRSASRGLILRSSALSGRK